MELLQYVSKQCANGIASRVSVVIPTYNRADTIEASIKSALYQTHPTWEVLVCDDGSTDNTESIVKSIDDARVKWIPGEHIGRPATPRNRGVRASTGEWLAFLDSDDEWATNKIKTQLDYAQEQGTLAVSSNAYRFVPQQGIVGSLLEYPKEFLTFDDLLIVNNVVCSSAMIHSSLVPLVLGFPEESYCRGVEDYALWLRVASQTNFSFVNEPLVTYRDTPSTSIRALDENVWVQRRHTFHNFLQWANPSFVGREYVDHAVQMYDQALKMVFLK